MRLLLLIFLAAAVSFRKQRNKCFDSLTYREQAQGKILIEKWDIQVDKKFADVKYEIKDSTLMSIDVHCLADADDIIVCINLVISI